MAVVLAFLVLGADRLPALASLHNSMTSAASPSYWPSILIYPILLYMLVWLPLQKMSEGRSAQTG